MFCLSNSIAASPTIENVSYSLSAYHCVIQIAMSDEMLSEEERKTLICINVHFCLSCKTFFSIHSVVEGISNLMQ